MPIFSVIIVTAPPFVTGADASAAFTKLDGREALLRTVELFLNRDEIKQIQLIVPTDLLDETRRKHGAHLGFSGVQVTGSAPKFSEQIATAASLLTADCSHVLVHDAARPCVPYTDIDALIASAAGKSPITALSQPLRGTLLELDEGDNPVGILPSSHYLNLVMPMLLTRQKLLELAGAKREPHASELNLLSGSALNVRIGSAADGAFAKAMLSMMPKPKSKAATSPFEEAQW